MLSSYSGLSVEIKEIKEKLENCFSNLEGIELTEREKYQNPQYRRWSGNIKGLEEFTRRLEEWLSQPSVAEARRYLLDLRKWSEPVREVSVDELAKDWRFLSDNVIEIGNIHKKLEGIGYDGIRQKASDWVLDRIIEKDLERAENWASNASRFALGLKKLHDRKVGTKLATVVKGDAVDELLKISSFDTDNVEVLEQYQEQVQSAENAVKNKPAEIEEKAVLKTYQINKGVKEGLNDVGSKLERIRELLIELEWVKELSGSKGYGKIWLAKKAAIGKGDLEKVVVALEKVKEKAKEWKAGHWVELNSVLLKTERMLKSTEKEALIRQIDSLKQESLGIDWSNPNLQQLFAILDKIGKMQKQLRRELVKKLKNKDAIAIIEEPKIIKDLGGEMGWDFDRFIKALEVVLRNGLIEIKPVEEK